MFIFDPEKIMYHMNSNEHIALKNICTHARKDFSQGDIYQNANVKIV